MIMAAAEPSWHDDLVYGLFLRCADPDRDVWRSELVLDIDHIVEWVRAADGTARFRVAAATLVFHDAGNLRIALDCARTGHGHTLNELSIARIVSHPAAPHPAAGGPPRRHYRIDLNMPAGGEIAFDASGHTLTLRSSPRLRDDQRLPPDDRLPLAL
jgi:hypothetical protein